MDTIQAIKLIRQNEQNFKSLPDDLKNYKEITLLAVSLNGYLLEYVNEKLKRDYDVVISALRQNASL